MMAKVFIFDQPDTLYEQCAQRILQLAKEVLDTQERFYLALAGGSTPRELYRHLSSTPSSSAPDWQRIEFYFGDERCVPPDHPDSNFRMAKETLFTPLGIAETAVHRIHGEEEPSDAVEHYLMDLKKMPQKNQQPRFDLVLLGTGADGHIASLFPGTALLKEEEQAFGANYVEKLGCWRLSLTMPVLNNARHILLLVSGSKKSDIVRHVLHGGGGALPLPVELLERENLEWFLDREAGHLLDEEYEA
jgi:6-phosphogluconolactonase